MPLEKKVAVHPIVSDIIVPIICVLIGVAGAKYLQSSDLKEPNLIFDPVVTTNITRKTHKFTVGNVTIKNVGNAKADNILFAIHLKGVEKNLKCSFQRSSNLIRVLVPPQIKVNTNSNNIYSIIYLNPADNVQFQFEVPNYIDSKNFVVELKANGFNGHELNK